MLWSDVAFQNWTDCGPLRTSQCQFLQKSGRLDGKVNRRVNIMFCLISSSFPSFNNEGCSILNSFMVSGGIHTHCSFLSWLKCLKCLHLINHYIISGNQSPLDEVIFYSELNKNAFLRLRLVVFVVPSVVSLRQQKSHRRQTVTCEKWPESFFTQIVTFWRPGGRAWRLRLWVEQIGLS